MSGIADRLRLLRGWTAILLGRSYRHRRQDIGVAFVPDRLHGYFVDLTAKTAYDGPVDDEGLPLTRARGRLVHHPTVVLQFGLGHWDRSLLGGDAGGHRRSFLTVARWTAANLDERGGLAVFPQLGLRTATPYSAMTQGLAISVLARASSLGEAGNWLGCARAAARLMLEPIEAGGTTRLGPAGIVLEEAPLVPPNTILNGWLFGLFGLHDLVMIDDAADPAVAEALRSTLAAFVDHLPRFDAGWWSLYDTAGHVASPFYHRLHVAQVRALEQTFPRETAGFTALEARWQRMLDSRVARARSVIVKAGQQLLHPPPLIK